MTTLTRILIFSPDADALAAALAAVADSSFTWSPTVRLDGTAARMAVVRIGGLAVQVCEGNAAAPAVLEVSVPDRAAAVARLEAVGATVTGGSRADVAGVRLVLHRAGR